MMRQWFAMKAEESVGEIVIYDAIGKSFWDDEAVTAKDFLDTLAALGDVKTINLRINSPGGDVFDGVAIQNALKKHPATVTAHIDGIAASAASLIAMAANKIIMPANTFMLVHQASGFAYGTADVAKALAADLERIDNSAAATYVARTGQTTDKVMALMKEDRLMDANEAKELGFADEVAKEVRMQMAANFSLHLLPKAAAARFTAATGAGQQQQGSPPQPAPVLQGPGAQPNTPPVPPTAEVIDLNAAKQQGVDEHKTYVASVTDLCTLARVLNRVGDYVRASTPIEQVRKELLELSAAPAVNVLPQHPLAAHSNAPASAWSKITDKINARMK
jgi:ATP-dependent protease ClpP protease subunit